MNTIKPIPMYDLRREYDLLQPEIDSAIQNVVQSGNFTLGTPCIEFEENMASFLDAEYTVGVSSGTAAILLSLLAYNIGRGDEVITAPNTDIATTSAISFTGASLVWVDIDKHSFNLDPQKIEAAITSRTKAIIPVHLHGNPAEMDIIMDIARKNGLLVIEDTCLALGAVYRNKFIGTIGDVGCFSLAPGKILGAYGDGGFIVTNNGKIADKIKILRNYGYPLGHGENLSGIKGPSKWTIEMEGLNERLDTLQAAIVNAKLPALPGKLSRRREIAEIYSAHFSSLDVVIPESPPYSKPAYRAYSLLTKRRDELQNYLASNNIASRTYYLPPLHQQPAYAHLSYSKGSFPATEETAQQMLSLPIYPEMEDSQIERLVSTVKRFHERA